MDEKTIDTYNKLAKEYDEEVADFWNHFPNEIIDNFKRELRKSAKILNIGSGSGRDALILKEAGLDVTCLDASESMIRITKSKGLDSVLADFNDIPFSDQSFDGIWAYTSLLHVPKKDINISLREIYRVLKSDGTLGLGFIEGKEEKYRESSGLNLPRYFAYYTKEELEKVLNNNGFKVFYFDTFKPRSKNYLNFLSKKI